MSKRITKEVREFVASLNNRERGWLLLRQQLGRSTLPLSAPKETRSARKSLNCPHPLS
jgi:hypothetical protein